MDSRVSIIIPIYNAVAYLRDCLDSIIGQSFADWHCICVDDGSTDGSSQLLDAYLEACPAYHDRFTVVHKANEGPGPSRTCGLGLTRSPWLMFLDADDILHPKTLETCFRCVDNDETIDAVSFPFTDLMSDLSDAGSVRTVDSPLLSYCRTPGANMAYSIAVCRLWKSSMVKGVKFKNWKNGEDTVWCVECLSHVAREVRLSSPLYWYRPSNGLHARSEAFDTLEASWREKVKFAPIFCAYQGVDAWGILRTRFSFKNFAMVRRMYKDGVISFELLPLAKRIILHAILFV